MLKYCLDFFLGAPTQPQQSAPTPTPAPANNNSGKATSATKPDSGHIQRKKFSIHPFRQNDVVTDHEEKWIENGGMMEGDTLVTKVVTASGVITDPAKLESICSVCGLSENEVIRCAESHVAICHRCKVSFERPDGAKVFVSPAVVPQMKAEFDTWKRFDARQKGLCE